MQPANYDCTIYVVCARLSYLFSCTLSYLCGQGGESMGTRLARLSMQADSAPTQGCTSHTAKCIDHRLIGLPIFQSNFFAVRSISVETYVSHNQINNVSAYSCYIAVYESSDFIRLPKLCVCRVFRRCETSCYFN